MGRARFDQVNLISGDPARSIAFYRLLGVDLPEARCHVMAPGMFHANAPCDDGPAASLEMDSVGFAKAWNPEWRETANLAGRIVLGFRVETREAVDDAYRRLADAGHRGLLAPHDAFWGARYAIVEDPDGVAVGIMSPRSDAHRSAPPI
jgi:catechol 2,3-dioxygenase-like lactoylglutathione lyase family enzyme